MLAMWSGFCVGGGWAAAVQFETGRLERKKMRCSDIRLIVLRRKVRAEPRLTKLMTMVRSSQIRFAGFPSFLKVPTIIRPRLIVRWHQGGFAATGVGEVRANREGDRRATRELRGLIRAGLKHGEIRFGGARHAIHGANCFKYSV